ncbi:ABC transporter substrate-binding protein [Subtercola lobariae]|uniref:Branched-chain amino acid ABC transporter substrate-binding protein n=1 Tax=Subtercola lobariae TaxID=1588641 RepID=A0A917B9S3_9MICO|nr:ABC transporter substrate-binding protein [Subtercola lobariae]GGF31813.1 branched-chain amino acid ABC transporter substrate-binding protein [Subtercola lobariae]
MSQVRKIAFGVAIVTAVTVLAGCSSSGSSGDDPNAGLTGTPIKLSMSAYIDSPIGSLPEIFSGAEVAAENINKAGGINGRPIQIETCNGKADAATEVTCAQNAVNDTQVLANISSVFAANQAGATQAMQAGGLADVGSVGGDPAVFALDNEYPIEFVPAMTNACAAPEVSGPDAKIGVIVLQNPFSQGTFQVMEPYLKSSAVGSRYVGSVSIPVTQQDYSSVIQELADKGANYIVPLTGQAAGAQIVTAANSAGHNWTFCADAGVFGTSAVSQLAPMTKEFLTSSGFPPTSADYPLVKQFDTEMAAAEKAGDSNASLQINPGNSMRAWLSVHIFAMVAAGISGDITRQSFSTAMTTAKVDLGYAQIDFSKPLGTPPFLRVFQPLATASRWDTGSNQFQKVSQVNLLDLNGN